MSVCELIWPSEHMQAKYSCVFALFKRMYNLEEMDDMVIHPPCGMWNLCRTSEHRWATATADVFQKRSQKLSLIITAIWF